MMEKEGKRVAQEWRSYKKQYEEIEAEYLQQLQSHGIPVGRPKNRNFEPQYKTLRKLGVRSFYGNAAWAWGQRSSGCEACVQGAGSKTCMLSLQCHRNCFFCFNPEKERGDSLTDWRKELKELGQMGRPVTHLALTGGEPLLFPEEAVAFFREANGMFPGCHTRLYTSGDLLDQMLLEQLQAAGLREIRFSVKLEDPEELREKVFANMALALKYIPTVMVEMPVIPGTRQIMELLLRRLDHMGVWGINLLEFCLPFHRAEEFVKRGMAIKNPPYQALYEYHYGGGMPVEDSEELCFALVEYAARKKLRLYVHYCSVENKCRGDMYQANVNYAKAHPLYELSQEDFFLRTVKVFGQDAKTAAKCLQQMGVREYQITGDEMLLCHPRYHTLLRKSGIPALLSWNVVERRAQGLVMREIKLT